MNNKKSIKILNTLAALHHDRQKGYEFAVVGSSDEDLKVMFNHFVRTSNQSKEELAREIKKMGGNPPEGERGGGKFFNAWVEVKDAVAAQEPTGILNACEDCEKIILEAYVTAIDDEDYLSEEQTSLVNSQHALLRLNQEELNEAKGSLTPHK